MSEQEREDAAQEPVEDLPELDYAAPMKHKPDGEDDELPGLDPTLTIPPED